MLELLFLLVAACLLPLTVYILALTYINSRPRPTVINGGWDFAFALVGLSGFVLAASALLVGTTDSLFRSAGLRGDWATMSEAFAQRGGTWLSVWGAGFAAVVTLASAGVVYRSRVIVIYNTDPEALPGQVHGAVEGLGWSGELGGNAITLSPVPGGRVEWDLIRSSRHATLRLGGVPKPARRALAAELDKVMHAADSPKNPAAGWLLAAASGLVGMMLFSVMYVATSVWDK